MVNMTSDMEIDGPSTKEKRSTYLPGTPMEDGETLVYDPTAYVMLHTARVVAPCLSFDVIKDDLGDDRETFPLSMYLVSGTQATKANMNSVIVLKFSNMNKTQKLKDSDSDSDDSDSSDEDETEEQEEKPIMDYVQIKHHGCINRIRSTEHNHTVLCAVWSERCKVSILDLKPPLQTIEGPQSVYSSKNQLNRRDEVRPLFVFHGHQTEGFSMDWSPIVQGVLATGDRRKHIHIWNPTEASWNVDQRPLVGHLQSVEDLQWSPNEANVLASCSVDKSIRIWDVRESPTNACKLTVENAHGSDVNVISWNRNEPFIVSGGDDGFLNVWDLRTFQEGKSLAKFKHHLGPVTTVEWHPKDASVFMSGGEDNQVAIWDLEAERDISEAVEDDVKHLPPQLLFIHQGQKEIKEVHWHPQIPGVAISTALSGINVFRTISV